MVLSSPRMRPGTAGDDRGAHQVRDILPAPRHLLADLRLAVRYTVMTVLGMQLNARAPIEEMAPDKRANSALPNIDDLPYRRA
jgi:hypothetical protein